MASTEPRSKWVQCRAGRNGWHHSKGVILIGEAHAHIGSGSLEDPAFNRPLGVEPCLFLLQLLCAFGGREGAAPSGIRQGVLPGHVLMGTCGGNSSYRAFMYATGGGGEPSQLPGPDFLVCRGSGTATLKFRRNGRHRTGIGDLTVVFEQAEMPSQVSIIAKQGPGGRLVPGLGKPVYESMATRFSHFAKTG